jgi:hypothetical protein
MTKHKLYCFIGDISTESFEYCSETEDILGLLRSPLYITRKNENLKVGFDYMYMSNEQAQDLINNGEAFITHQNTGYLSLVKIDSLKSVYDTCLVDEFCYNQLNSLKDEWNIDVEPIHLSKMKMLKAC